MFVESVVLKVRGEVAVGKAAVGLPAAVGNTIRGVRIPSLSATN